MRNLLLSKLFLVLFVCFCSGVYAQNRAISDKENRTAYGIILHNSIFNYEYGIGTFNTGNPENMKLLNAWHNNLNIYAGAAANGEYYGFFYQYDYFGPIPRTFSKINLRTGALTTVKDWSDMKVKLQDMTYDYSTQTMYALGFDASSYLYTIDLETGDITQGPEIKVTLATLAATYEGRLYGINLKGILYEINKQTGEVTEVLKMNVPLYSMQSMEFDHTDGALYWCSDLHDVDQPELVNQLYKIDVEQKTYKTIGQLADGGVEVVGLYIPFVLAGFDAPGQATEVKATPAEKGKEEAVITWKNPAKTHGGDPLSGKLSISLLRDNQIIGNMVGNAGEEMSWPDNDVKQGEHVYTVIAKDPIHGDGARVDVDVYVGNDYPTYVNDLELTVGEKCESINLTWSIPSVGTHNGYYDPSNITYKLIRYPDKKVIADELRETSYKDEDINRLGSYSYGIIATNAAGSSQEAISESVIAGKAIDIPYSCEFNDGNAAMNQWTIADGNGDGMKLTVNSGFNQMIFKDNVYAVDYLIDPSYSQKDADEWLISPPLNFEAGKNYKVSFDVRSVGKDEFNFTFGELNTPESQQIVTSSIETEEGNLRHQHHELQIPKELTTAGVHCVGFNLVTVFDMSAYFQITNISIDEGVVNSIESTMAGNQVNVIIEDGKLSITGDFDGAEIYNTTGVCIASVDNNQTQLGTINWQPGIYFVKVTNASTTYTKKVIIK